ncbi:MAG: HD family hydrolase [Nanohaloarchaea archaeon]|nr:HD family hydrolase [Candidatus Nanohaloarchaea archaeon]
MSDDLDFILESYNVKDEVRTGWLFKGVRDPESVASHVWGVKFLCLLYAEEEDVDEGRAVKMAVIQDLPEAKTGDLVSEKHAERYELTDEEKDRKERVAMHELPPENRFDDIIELWEEYQERETRTARFVKDMDMIDMCFQALKYEIEHRRSPEKSMDEFFEYTEPRLNTDTGKELFEELKSRYEKVKKE